MEQTTKNPNFFKEIDELLMQRVDELDPTWQLARDKPLQEVPVISADGSKVEVIVSSSQLTVDIHKFFKGKSKDAVIMKHAHDFLESGCDFKSFPMQLKFRAAPYAPIETNDVVPKNGLARSHALKVAKLSIVNAALTDEEMKLILPAIKTFFFIKGVVSTTGDDKTDAWNAMRDKMGLAGSQTPSLAYC